MHKQKLSIFLIHCSQHFFFFFKPCKQWVCEWVSEWVSESRYLRQFVESGATWNKMPPPPMVGGQVNWKKVPNYGRNVLKGGRGQKNTKFWNGWERLFATYFSFTYFFSIFLRFFRGPVTEISVFFSSSLINNPSPPMVTCFL